MEIKGKKISIIGAVRSGIGAARLSKKLGAVPFVSDSGNEEKLKSSVALFESEGIDFELGGHSKRVYECDLMITSPGVPTDSEVLKTAAARKIKIISEIEFASWFCKGGIIAITGTNGKTTTTALMNHTLNECGIKSYTAGNIGNAFSEIVLDVKEDQFVSLETSSFQLDFTEKFKPFFSVVLNITPDHLDRYQNKLENYIASKIKISANQDESDFFLFNADDLNTSLTLRNKRVQKLSFSLHKEVPAGAFVKKGKMFFAWFGALEEVCPVTDLFIKGEHNVANALAVLAVAKTLNLPNMKISSAFKSFHGVEHRIEFVRELNGVQYYNDSKATNVDSVVVALKSFEKPVYLILGGKDKGNDYSQIESLVRSNVKKIYAIGVSAEKVKSFFESIVETEIKNSLEECVESAMLQALPGSVVLLSPACASFDMFTDYEHRGRVFKKAVNNL